MRLLLFLFPLCLWAQAGLRPPATPLIAHDPYFSVWSMADDLTAEDTNHWTGSPQPIGGILRVDGKAFRFIGAGPRNMPAVKQLSRTVTPTRTIYEFEAAGVSLGLTFLTPAFADDLDVLSRPVTYVIWNTKSSDAKPHSVELYLDAGAEIAVNSLDQKVNWSRVRAGSVSALRVGSTTQEMLSRSGDNLRIDWGYFYLALPPGSKAELVSGAPGMRGQFGETGRLPDTDLLEPSTRAQRGAVTLAAAWPSGSVDARPVEGWAMFAYDDQFSIQYLQRNLRPWWRRDGTGISELLQKAAAEFEGLRKRSISYDQALTDKLVKAGGDRYAAIAILAYRQALAAHKLVADLDGTPLYFSKENFSNGCIATVDITYPSAPLFLALSPRLMRAMLQPVLYYASLPRWRFPFAPHDIGQYPLANGQVYGGGEKTETNQMPVEESGNLLILMAALSKAEGSAAMAEQYWTVLSKWAAYLREKGMDPENQLSTDDFAGHLAHNTNLSIKAIVALGAYAQLAEALKYPAVAKEYMDAARSMAARWNDMALDGDHYKLAFDKPGTWSQKYNLVWDRILSLGLFPKQIAATEMAYYRKTQNKYGLPLDNRSTYTKLDWIIWTATLTGKRADFEALTNPVFDFLNDSPSRVPMTDWYWTTDAKQRGFQARSVVGGVFIPLLNPVQ